MIPMSRRNLISTAAAGLLTATTVAEAQTGTGVPQPSRGPGIGGTDPGPRNPDGLAAQNPDMLNPPATDPHGTLPNLKFSFADAHVRQESGGWTRQVTERELGMLQIDCGRGYAL